MAPSGPRIAGAGRLIGRAAPAVALAVTLFGGSPLPAEPDAGAMTAEDERELESLLAVLAEETAVATRSKMNADFVPGIVTVLDADELAALGATTVAEALSLVPGVVVDRDEAGSPLLRVRGLDFFFNSGNVKVLVDGLPLSRETAGINGSVLLMPIEQVERVEMIRGPGSGLYGDFAFVGLVNVVTRRETGVFARAGSGDLRAGGASWARGPDGADDGGLSAAASASTWNSHRGDAPNDARGDEERSFATGSLAVGGFSLTATAMRRDQFTTASPAGRPTGERSAVVEARQAWSLGPEREAAVSLAYLDNRIFFGPLAFDGDRLIGSAALDWRAGRQRWLIQGSYAVSTIEEASQTPPPGIPLPPVSLRNLDRDVVTVAIQDQIDLGSRTTVTGGVRWDSFSDVGDVVTPRLAAVFRLSDRHTLKAQVAEGYRAPIFFELYAGGFNPEVEPETIRTSELGYVYRRPSSVGRATLFRSEIDGLLLPNPRAPGRFANADGATAEGLELEWTHELGGRLKLIAGVARIETEDSRGAPPGTTRDSLSASDLVGDLALLWRPVDALLLGLRWDHVGRRALIATTADGYDLVDLTATFRPRRPSGLALRVGLRNLLDDRVSTWIQRPNVVRELVYDQQTVTVALSWAWP